MIDYLTGTRCQHTGRQSTILEHAPAIPHWPEQGRDSRTSACKTNLSLAWYSRMIWSIRSCTWPRGDIGSGLLWFDRGPNPLAWRLARTNDSSMRPLAVAFKLAKLKSRDDLAEMIHMLLFKRKGEVCPTTSICAIANCQATFVLPQDQYRSAPRRCKTLVRRPFRAHLTIWLRQHVPSTSGPSINALLLSRVVQA